MNVQAKTHLTLALGASAVAGAIGAIPNLDLALAKIPFRADLRPPWFGHHNIPWTWLYDYGFYPTWILVAILMTILAASAFHHPWRRLQRPAVIFIFTVALGPGLLINGVLKPNWGRYRPAQLEQFNGQHHFVTWYQPQGPDTGKSFCSGHVSMGAALFVAALLIASHRKKTRTAAIALSLIFTASLAAARISQGGHFLSDCLFGFTLTWLVAAALMLLPETYPQPRAPDQSN